MMIALQQLTPNIQIGPKKSQKQRKLQPGLTKQDISDIAGRVAHGKIELPSRLSMQLSGRLWTPAKANPVLIRPSTLNM